MSSFHGTRVSTTWGIVLRSAERDHVSIELNEGRRTMAEQQRLVNIKGLWSPSNPTGAARPSPIAPHIRVGREDHALDINYPNVLHLQSWLSRHGVAAHRPIPQEPWHLEVLSEKALIALAKRLKRPTKRERLALELSNIRAVVRQRFKGNWNKAPKRRRRAESIKAYLRKHKR